MSTKSGISLAANFDAPVADAFKPQASRVSATASKPIASGPRTVTTLSSKAQGKQSLQTSHVPQRPELTMTGKSSNARSSTVEDAVAHLKLLSKMQPSPSKTGSSTAQFLGKSNAETLQILWKMTNSSAVALTSSSPH